MSHHNEQPEGFRLPFDLADEAEALLRERAWEQIVRGDTDAETFAEIVADAEAIFDSVVEARRAQQAQWNDAETATTLTRAFAALAEIGVVARENFSCCGTCGAAEIGDERDDSRTWRGYVFYDQQDTDSLIADGETYLSYGAFLDAWLPALRGPSSLGAPQGPDEWNDLDDDAKDAAYTRIVTALMIDEVFPVLERHGITARWDGDLGRRILLQGVDYYVKV
ncbi:MAG: hypothetical protein QM597_03785 [Aeromicrobium sp.]|uniref:DUF6891 domain-containing protein n=1 Tax=Aeromicrobium sp. TaxID=1871063 RepID=UPI0039E630BC